jgi:Rieske Fe-S protein
MNTDRTKMALRRRRFVKLLTLGTATALMGGRWWQRSVLASVRKARSAGGVFKIHVSDYPTLQGGIGSVRLGINPVRPDREPFPDGDFYPILVTRDGDGQFHVLDAECRHAGCVVPATEGFTIVCPCHGSTYWIDGKVIGGPATQSLRTYDFEFDGQDTLTIRVPAWAFSVHASVIPGDANSRVKLDFLASPEVLYEMNFRPRLEDPWTVISFATSPAGPANETSLMGVGLPETVYVERPTPTGFYAVAMRLNEV